MQIHRKIENITLSLLFLVSQWLHMHSRRELIFLQTPLWRQRHDGDRHRRKRKKKNPKPPSLVHAISPYRSKENAPLGQGESVCTHMNNEGCMENQRRGMVSMTGYRSLLQRENPCGSVLRYAVLHRFQVPYMYMNPDYVMPCRLFSRPSG